MVVADDAPAAASRIEPDDRPTFWQRRMLKSLIKKAKKHPGEELSPEDWELYFTFGAQRSARAMKKMLRSLPSTPRCGFCGAPFDGLGGRIVRPLGYRPSRKNPSLCAVCVEMAPPGGMTTDVGVLFADLRGFTSRSETLTPSETNTLLRGFYRCAEQVLLPQALIDKLIGDEVMALYVPYFVKQLTNQTEPAGGNTIAGIMLHHAHELLERIGYGSTDGPSLEVGIGLDFGEAFIGNIGDESVRDFTAVGDVVNTASRLQGEAASGEIVMSARAAQHLDRPPPGEFEHLELKGKQQPVDAYRIAWSSD